MSDLRFRVQTASGPSCDVIVQSEATIDHLIHAVALATQEDPKCITIMYKESAFPPKWAKLPDDPFLPLASMPLKTNTILQANVVPGAADTSLPITSSPIKRADVVDLTSIDAMAPFNGGAEAVTPARPRRQAAINADGVMAAMIEAQESMIASERATRGKSKPAKVSSPQPARGFGAVAGLRASTTPSRAPSTPSTPQAGRKRMRPFAGGFGQLHRTKRPRRWKHVAAEGADTDVADPMSLLSHRMMVAVSSSSRSGDPLMSFFRNAAQKAVASQYEISRAVARVTAARSGHYKITPSASSRVASTGMPSRCVVRFQVSAKKWEEEVVDNLSCDVASAVLKLIVTGDDPTCKEMVKPEMAAQLLQISPRQFWSWVRYGHLKSLPGSNLSAAEALSEGHPVDLEAAWQRLVPDGDFGFLTRRVRKLSAKAVEQAALSALKRPPVVASATTAGLAQCVESADSAAGNLQAATTIGPSMARVEAAHIRACIREAAFAGPSQSASTNRVVPLEMVLSALGKCGVLLAMPPQPAGDYTASSLQSALHGFRTADLAKRLAEDFPVPLFGANAACETFICDTCQRSRKVAEYEADLNQLLDAPTWSCTHGKIPRLVARGGCEAADDDLCELLGDEFSASICSVLGLFNAVDVARALLPEETVLMYTGPEGPINESEGAECGIQADDAGSDIAGGEPLCVRLRSRLPPVQVVCLDESQVAAHSATMCPGSRLHVHQLMHRILGHKLLYSAVTAIVAVARGFTTKHPANAGLLVGGLSGDMSVSNTLVSRVQHEWETEKLDYQELLRHPIVLGAALRLAEYWQSFCRASVVEDFMAFILSTSCEDAMDADSLQNALGKLDINAPADLLQYDATALTSAISRVLKEEEAAVDEAELAPVIERLLRGATELVEKTQWLKDIVST